MKKTKKIAIHGDFVEEAADKIEELGLVAVIVGANKRWENAMDVELQYERTERDEVHELEKFLDDLWIDLGYPPDWAEEEGDEYRGKGNYDTDKEEEEEEEDEDDEDEDY